MLLLVCAFAVGLSLQVRSDAATNSRSGATLFRVLRRALASGTEARARTTTAAPAAAFLDAATAGLATAQLQVYLSQVAVQSAMPFSSRMAWSRRVARIRPTRSGFRPLWTLARSHCRNCFISWKVRTPYVFVDLLAVQPASTAVQRAAGDPTLRLTLSLRALWRRGSA